MGRLDLGFGQLVGGDLHLGLQLVLASRAGPHLLCDLVAVAVAADDLAFDRARPGRGSRRRPPRPPQRRRARRRAAPRRRRGGGAAPRGGARRAGPRRGGRGAGRARRRCAPPRAPPRAPPPAPAPNGRGRDRRRRHSAPRRSRSAPPPACGRARPGRPRQRRRRGSGGPARRAAPPGSPPARPRGRRGVAARTATRSCSPRSLVSSPQARVRSRSRAAKRSSAARRRSLTSTSRSSSAARAARAFAAAFSAAAARSAPKRSSSATSCPRSPSSSRSIRNPSSAACAWRFSGRRRARASRSRSSARSRLSRAALSFSSARRRRLRCLPSPAASSTSSRRSRGLEWTIDSTRPWLITECISRPRLVSERTSTTSTRRQRAPLRRYSPSPERSSRRCTETSENSVAARPRSCRSRPRPRQRAADRRPCRRRRSRPASRLPRIAPGLCSPSAHSTASVMFDLPEPFGPTITLTPGENSSLARSGNDLNPFIVDRSSDTSRLVLGPGSLRLPAESDAKLTPPAQPPSSLQRLLGGGLLGRLLAPARSFSDPLGVDDRRHLEGPPVRRAGLGDHLVAYARTAPREQLLQGGLEVDPGLGRVLDPRLERRRPPPPRRARSRRRGSRRRSAPRSPPAAAARRRAGPRPESPSAASGSASSQHLRHTEQSRPTSAQETPLTAWLWILVRPPESMSGKRAKQGRGNREAEHAVAEEGEPLVGLDPRLRSRRSGSAPGCAGPPGGRRSAPRALRQQARHPRANRSGRGVLEDELDRVADRLDPRRLLLGDRDRRSGPPAPSPARRGRASRRRGPP